MIEIIKHLFGVCGEGHVNIFSILFGYIPDIPYINSIIKHEIKESIKKWVNEK